MAKKNHVTFALQINNRPNRFGQYAIYIRITQDRKFRHIKTSVQVSNKALFNKNARNENWIRQTDLEFAKKNATLAHELGEAKKAYVDLIEEDKVVTLNAIAEKTVEAPISGSFMQFFKEFNDSLHAGGQIRYWKQFNDVYNKIMVFMKKCRMKDVLFSDLTPKFIDRFVRHLSTLPNQRHPDQVLHKNTIQNVLKRFRTLTRRAVKLGYMSYDKDPFLNYQFHWITTTKDKLDSDEINRIMALELIEDSPLWHTRNCFLFSFYCAGIRAGDLLQLRWRNVEGNRLVYRMGKNHKERNLILVPQAITILELYRKRLNEQDVPDHYIFPFLNNAKTYAKALTQEQKDTMSVELKEALFRDISIQNAYLNKNLGELAKKANIDKHISFHVSRHSFAKLAKDKGTNSAVVQGLLAHSSLKTTENYMGQFDTTVEDEAMSKIFGSDEENNKMESLLANLTDREKEMLRHLLEKK
jgi:integrase